MAVNRDAIRDLLVPGFVSFVDRTTEMRYTGLAQLKAQEAQQAYDNAQMANLPEPMIQAYQEQAAQLAQQALQLANPPYGPQRQSLLDLPYGLGTTTGTAAMPPSEVMRAYLGLSNDDLRESFQQTEGIAAASIFNGGEAPAPEAIAQPVDPHEPKIDLDGPTEIAVPKPRGRSIDL